MIWPLIFQLADLDDRCPCGENFCYVCGQKWKSSAWPHWKEPPLLTRAAQILDRTPGRQLFQRDRVARSQPATHRLSTSSTIAEPTLIRVLAAALHAGVPVWESDFSDRS